jgi:uncharacterized protein (TIGR03437 family)
MPATKTATATFPTHIDSPEASGGTGKLAGASGTINYFGMADFNKNTPVLRYSGKVAIDKHSEGGAPLAYQITRTSHAMAILVFAIATSTNVHAQTYSVLASFYNAGGGTVGYNPAPAFPGVVAQGRDGNLYTTTARSGVNGAGAIFQVTPAGALKTIHSFSGGVAPVSPYNPQSGLTLGTDGFFYGTTLANNSFYGAVFKADSSGNVTVLYSFKNRGDGAIPWAPPIQGTDGSLYGTTTNTDGVYKLAPDGTFTALYAFGLLEGQGNLAPGVQAPLVQGSDGYFYGTTLRGVPGQSNFLGTVFKITSTGAITYIYNFDNTHGATPIGPVIQASDGYFYGTTSAGGDNGFGVVFKLTSSGVLTVLHSFNGTDGKTPIAGLVQANNGVFYGTASAGGTLGFGTIFKITSTGTFSVIHNFDNTTGATPTVTLVQHTNGLLYGDTSAGGANGATIQGIPTTFGVVYSLNDSLQPFVSLLPTSGQFNATIGILGQGFTGTTNVSFNGGSAAFTVVSDTFLTVAVPSNGVTGKVTVTTPKGTLTSDKVFTAIPVITSVMNAGSYTSSLAPGSAAAVFGTNLGIIAAAGAQVGGQTAQVLLATATQWSVAIPYNAVTGSNTIQIGTAAPFPITLAKYAPALFSVDGSGLGNVVAQRLLTSSAPSVSAAAPAIPGDMIILYATGLGAIDASGNTIPLPTVTVGGQAVTVVSAVAIGSANPGTYQVTIQLPVTTPGGSLPVILSIGGANSPSLALPVGVLTGLAITNVVNGGSFLTGFSQGSWTTITGANLSGTTRIWTGADFTGANLPTQLDKVSVTIDGKPAFVYYISPTQLNVLSPADTAVGPVPVQVTYAGQTSNVLNGAEAAFAPAMFMFSPLAQKYVAAVRSDGQYLGPATLYPGLTVPAHAGDVILLYGTGFGPTNPTTDFSQTFSGAPPTVNTVTATIGGVPATVQFAGLVAPGEYQFNVLVPGGLTGDNLVVLKVGGVSSQANAYLAVQ